MDWICPECADRPTVSAPSSGEAAPSCHQCGHEPLFRRLPLLVVTGPSGVGKSAIAADLAVAPDPPDAVYLDSDTLLVKGLSDRGWDEYRDVWVWTCANIAQSGRPVVLFGGGDPIEFARAARIDCFSTAHFMALTCDEEELRRRLLARPARRKSSEPAFMHAMVDWNARLEIGSDPNGVTWDVVNTAQCSRSMAAQDVARWVGRHWPAGPGDAR